MSRETKTYRSLEEYAKHVRLETHNLMAALSRRLGPTDEATLRVLDLCSEAAGIVQQHRMRQEVGSGDYDLATLPAPQAVDVENDVENPFHNE